MCALLLAGMACAFGRLAMWKKVSNVRRMEKCTLKEFEEVSEVSNTFTEREDFWYGFSRQPCAFFAWLATAPLILVNLATILKHARQAFSLDHVLPKFRQRAKY